MRVNWFRIKAIAVLAAVAMFAPLVAMAAAPAFPALGSSIHQFAFHISGAKTATETNSIKFNAPFNMRLLYATMSSRLKSGTFDGGVGQKSLVTVLNAGQAAMTMDLIQPAAGVVQEATNVTAQLNVAKDAAVSVDILLHGASPSITDTSIVIWTQRQN